MLNPKHIMKLNQALHLIIGPHSDFPTTNLTQLIHEGERILSQLKKYPTFPQLLSNYLVSSNDYQNNAHRIPLKLQVNYKKFVLLEISKIVPLHHETIWWHLLQFYYGCNQKMESIVLDIVVRHFKKQNDEYCNAYRPFLMANGDWSKSSMLRVAKVINLVGILVKELGQLAQNVEYSNQWKIGQVQYIMEFLLKFLEEIGGNFANLCERVCLCVLQLLMSGHQIANRQRSCGQIEFRQKTINHLNQKMNQLQYFPQTIRIIVDLYSKNLQLQHKFQYLSSEQHLPATLATLLRVKPNKNNTHVHLFRTLTYALCHIQTNQQILQGYCPQILEVYQKYIMDVQVGKPVQQVLPHEKQLTEKQDEILQSFSPIPQYLCFQIMSQCLRIVYSSQNPQTIEPNFLLLAYSNTSPFQLSQNVLSSILSHLKSTIHHPKAMNLPKTIACLRLLYLHFVDNPNHDLIELATCILNLRVCCPELQKLCDFVLCRAASMMVTCVSGDRLWDCVGFWIGLLMDNYMDVSAVSYYPILLILETAPDYYYTDHDHRVNFPYNQAKPINFILFFEHVLQLLLQQAKNVKNATANHSEYSWCDNYEIFYKWCATFIHYLGSINIIVSIQTSLEFKSGQNIQKNIHKTTLQAILKKAKSHIFRNQLYCAHTAYLFVCSLIFQGKSQGLIEFVHNLNTEAFWKGFDQGRVVFYCCAFLGIVRFWDQKLGENCVYPNFAHIFYRTALGQSFGVGNLAYIKSQITEFLSLYSSGPSIRQQEILNILSQKCNHSFEHFPNSSQTAL